VRRKWLLLAALGAVLIGGVGAAHWLYLRSQDQAMRAKFAEIRAGMTLGDVEALMGRPFEGSYWAGDGSHAKGWNGPGSLTVDVFVDDHGIVLSKEIHPTAQMTPWEELLWKIYRWLGW
jgi:hypothetical protein